MGRMGSIALQLAGSDYWETYKMGHRRGLRRGLMAGSLVGVMVGVGLTHTPVAKADSHSVITFLKWGGEDCIWAASPTYGNYWAVATDYVCDPDHSIVFNTPALGGQYIGVDPVITPGITWAGCSVVIDRTLDFADYAEAGDSGDVNCLRVLK